MSNTEFTNKTAMKLLIIPLNDEYIHWKKKTQQSQMYFKRQYAGLPWGLKGEESAYQCRRHRFNHWYRKIPHATKHLSPWATTTEPVLWSPWDTTTEPMCRNYGSLSSPEPMLLNRESHRNKRPKHHDWRIAPTAAKTQQAKNNSFLKKF